jgi:hypothetical protein
VSAALIALATYWPCSQGQSPGWTAIRRALDLIRGNVNPPYAGGTGCVGSLPLGLQAAQLLMLSALGIVGWGAVALIFATRFREFRARSARAVVVISGLDDSTVGMVRRVRATVPAPAVLVAAVPAGQSRAAELARDVGAIPIELDLLSPTAVRRFASRRRRDAVRGAYLLGPDAADNLRALEILRTAFRDPVSRPGFPSRAAVRIDDPWHADDWRRRHMAGDPDWLVDAVSAVEGAARHVVRELRGTGVELVVLTDASPFELAVLSELSFERRMSAVVPDAAGVRGFPRVALTGDRAEEVAEHFTAQLARFGIAHPGIGCEVVRDPLDEVMKGAERAALLMSFSEGEGASRSTFVAARRPDWAIFAWSPTAHGLGPGPLVGGLTSVGPTLEPVDGHGVDLWDRFGRTLHERYVQLHLDGEPVVGDPARGRWDEDLSPFTREANIRSFLAAMRGVRLLGLRWATTLAASDARVDLAALSEPEIEVLARAEHESWVEHHRAYGWRPGAARDDRRRMHPDLVDWDRLSPASRQKDVAAISGTLGLLDVLGFRLQVAASTADPIREPAR